MNMMNIVSHDGEMNVAVRTSDAAMNTYEYIWVPIVGNVSAWNRWLGKPMSAYCG